MSLLSRLWACCRPQKADQAFQDLYGAQLKHHEEDPLFAAIIRDDLAEVRRLCAEDPQRLRTHDPMGAYPIHIAFLRGAPPFDMGKALVVADPEWATCQYAAGKKKDLPCAGENILHIAIIRQEVELVKWLLQRAPGLLKGEATGSFFAPGRDTYFGGYPLLFAVASNQMEMVEAILGLQLRRPDPELERYSSIFLQDAHGNGALHLCVVHDLKEMYDFCVEEAEEEQATARTAQRSAGDVPFGIRPNKEHLTPLALAAAMGNAAMFRHLLLADKREGWEYGPIKSYMVPLAGLEHSTGGRAKTAVKCLCAGRAPLTKCLRVNSAGEVDDRVYKGRLEIVDLPQVQQLLDKKWKYFGCRVFWRKCISFLTMQVLWTISVVIPHHYRLDKDNFGQYPVENIAIVALEAVVGLLVLQRLWKEGTEIVRERAAYFDNMRGAAAFDNLCTVLFIIFYVAGFLFRRAGERWPATYHPHLRPQWPLYALDDFCHAFAAFVGWMNLFFFLLGMRSTGPFIIMITEMVSVDLRRFMAVYIAVLLSYGMSMYLVLDSYTAPGLARFGRRFWELTLLGTTGELPASLDQWQHSLNGWWANLLLISYIVFVMILLLNLLIAMMNNRYTMIDEVAVQRWYVERASMMICFEGELTPKEMERERRKFAVNRPHEGSCRFFMEIQQVDDEDWKRQRHEKEVQAVQVQVLRDQATKRRFVRTLAQKQSRIAAAAGAALELADVVDLVDLLAHEDRLRGWIESQEVEHRSYIRESMAMRSRTLTMDQYGLRGFRDPSSPTDQCSSPGGMSEV